MKELSSPIKLIKESFNIFFEKKNLPYFMKVYAPLIPFQLFFLYQNYFVATQSQALGVTDATSVLNRYPWFLATVIAVNIVFVVVSFLVSMAGIKAINGVTGKKVLPLKELFRTSLKRLWPFALLVVVLTLIEFGGLLLLIIPGILFAVWYGFAKFVLVTEGKGVRKSLAGSKKLVEGRFWKVFGRMAVFVLFALLIQMLFAVVPYGIGSLIAQLFEALIVLPSFLLYKELAVKELKN
jgi:hypothetical protein